MKRNSKTLAVCIHYTNSSCFQNQWDYVLSHYNLTNLYIIGAPKKDVFDGNNVFKTAQLIKNAEKLPKNKPLILMAPKNGRYVQGTVSLIDFVHPSHATYFFGPDNLHVSEDILGSRQPDHKVYIPTKTKDNIYSFIAAAITFYDRMVKHG